MKKTTTLLFIILLCFCNILQGNIRYFIEFKGNYTFAPNEIQILKLVITLRPFVGNPYSDTFFVSGNSHYVHRIDLPSGKHSNQVSLTVHKPNNQVIGNYIVGNSWDNQICDGYENKLIFNGNNCVSLSAYNAGILCGAIKLNFIDDQYLDNILIKKGHFSDPWGIYCDPDISNQEALLELHAPCHFRYYKGSSHISWYESASPLGPWQFIDTGEKILPARKSWKKGSKMFNQKRFYKAIVDTAWITNSANLESSIFGPVRFYLNSRPDSIVANFECKDTAKGIFVLLKNDSLSQTNSGISIFLWTMPDTGASERYHFGRFYFQNKINIHGQIGQVDPYFSGNPTAGKKFVAQPGKYRIYVDFAPWRGFDCKVKFDTIEVLSGKTYHPFISFSNKESCPGKSDGSFSINVRNFDADDSVEHSYDSLNWRFAADTVKNLKKGTSTVWFKNTTGCIKKMEVMVEGSPEFGYRLNIDTTLCNGQKLTIKTSHINASKFEIKFNNNSISSADTFSFIDSGTYAMEWTNKDGCKAMDTANIRRFNLSVAHDFLVPSKALITDTVYAVDQSIPEPDTIFWKWNKAVKSTHMVNFHSFKTRFDDSGVYILTQNARYKQCGFQISKKVVIGNGNDTGNSNNSYGYKGPLIQSFSTDPNPNDGTNFTINVRLREKANIVIYKLDAVSGDIIGDIDYYNKSEYSIKAFQGASSGIYYLKLLAGDESKTIKVVVIQ